MKKDRRRTGLFISCPCGSKAAIVETGWGYYGHCPQCGRLTFFRSDSLLEKVRLGAKSVCDHAIKLKDCKSGRTGWCPLCRVRIFVPSGGKEQ